MKKNLLTTAAAAVIATSSAYAAQDGFYVKAQAGMSSFNNKKVHKVKIKSKNTGFLGVAAGYHVMDNVRVELAFDHFMKPTFKTKNMGDLKIHTGDGKLAVDHIHKAKSKLNINTLMLNSFVDVFDADMIKVFVGGGVGIAQTSAKTTWTKVKTAAVNDSTPAVTEDVVKKSKKKTRGAFAGYVGAAYEIADGVNAELTYSYKYLSKVEIKDINDKKASDKLKSHNVGIGIRFDI